MAKRCHICLEDMVSFSSKKKCCKAFICDTCLSQCVDNDIVRCPVCRTEFEDEIIQLDLSSEINDCNSSVLYSLLFISSLMILLFVATLVIIVISYHEKDYTTYDIILYTLIISLIGIISCIFGCIISLIYCRR